MSFHFLRPAFVACLMGTVSLSTSCSSRFLKASPTQLSGFLEPSPVVKSERKRTPFLLSGGSAVTPAKEIYIAPISLEHLSPESKVLAKVEGGDKSQEEAAKRLAAYGQRKFVDAFEKSAKARYQTLDAPNRNCVVLEMAITELHRNTILGGLVKLAVHPLLEPFLTKPASGLKGNVAIEGKLREARTGKVVFQFADTEEGRSLILPIKDFIPYAQAREAFRDWARQFEKLTRVAPGKRVGDTWVLGVF